MTAAGQTTFIDQMRAKADQGARRSAVLWGILDALLAIWGIAVLGSTENGSAWLGLAMIVGAIAGIYYIVRLAKRRLSAAENPLIVQLRAYGDPPAVGRLVNAAFFGRPFVSRKLLMGENWLCYVRGVQVMVRHLDSLVWAYGDRIRHRVNYIPYRPATYELILWDRSDRAAALPMGKAAALASLEILRKAAPWMLIGTSDTLKASWNEDHAAFIAAVDARHSEFLASKLAAKTEAPPPDSHAKQS